MYVTQNASRLRIPDHFPLPSLRVADFKRFISVSQRYFSHSHRSIFTTLGEMTVADNVMNPQDLERNESDPADIQIRVRINPDIWIRTQDCHTRVISRVAYVVVIML